VEQPVFLVSLVIIIINNIIAIIINNIIININIFIVIKCKTTSTFHFLDKFKTLKSVLP